VDPALNARIPAYLRGQSSLYHYEDDGDVLAMTVKGFPNMPWHADPHLPRLGSIQHEWHFGVKHPDLREMILPTLENAALAMPDAMVVISHRAMRGEGIELDFQKTALACLRGRDFAAFLRDKGRVDTAKIVWYRNVDIHELDRIFASPFHDIYWGEGPKLPVFLDAINRQPSLPLYSYPFKTAPMHSDEYSIGSERTCLLPLGEDYPPDDDEGEGDEGFAQHSNLTAAEMAANLSDYMKFMASKSGGPASPDDVNGDRSPR